MKDIEGLVDEMRGNYELCNHWVDRAVASAFGGVVIVAAICMCIIVGDSENM